MLKRLLHDKRYYKDINKKWGSKLYSVVVDFYKQMYCFLYFTAISNKSSSYIKNIDIFLR